MNNNFIFTPIFVPNLLRIFRHPCQQVHSVKHAYLSEFSFHHLNVGTGYPEGVAPHVRVMGFPSTATGCSGKIYVFPGACLILMSMVAFPVRVTFPLPVEKKGKIN